MSLLLISPLRVAARLLRSLFGPIAPNAWIYVAFPIFFLLGQVVAEPGLGIPTYAAWFGAAFTSMLCLGLPMHLWYGHFGDAFIGDEFRWQELPIHAVVVGTGTLIGTELGLLIVVPIWAPLLAPDLSATPELIWGWRTAGWAIGLMGGGMTTAVLTSLDRYRDRIAEAEKREMEAQNVASRAQLQALQARVQPHFLFNALNTVAGLIEEDPKRAERTIERLASIFRYTLEASKVSLLPLGQELAIVRDYLALETIRHGDRLKTTVHVDEEAIPVLVPPLLLQPIVENAVLHGISQRRAGGRVEVSATLSGETLELCVEDDGPGPGHSSHRGSGTALDDLQRRLELTFGEAATADIDSGALGGFRIRMRLPISRTLTQSESGTL